MSRGAEQNRHFKLDVVVQLWHQKLHLFRLCLTWAAGILCCFNRGFSWQSYMCTLTSTGSHKPNVCQGLTELNLVNTLYIIQYKVMWKHFIIVQSHLCLRVDFYMSILNISCGKCSCAVLKQTRTALNITVTWKKRVSRLFKEVGNNTLTCPLGLTKDDVDH